MIRYDSRKWCPRSCSNHVYLAMTSLFWTQRILQKKLTKQDDTSWTFGLARWPYPNRTKKPRYVFSFARSYWPRKLTREKKNLSRTTKNLVLRKKVDNWYVCILGCLDILSKLSTYKYYMILIRTQSCEQNKNYLCLII